MINWITSKVSRCLVGAAILTAAAADRAMSQTAPTKTEHPFDKNVKVAVTAEELVVESDGIPTHATGTFPNPTNPNTIRKQSYRFHIPTHPKKAEKSTPTPFGPIGVAVNGIPFYNPYNAQGRDAVLGPSAEIFDSCCGHPDPMGRYHYHKYPVCLKTPFKETEGKHSPLLGLMFDGFALYGPNAEKGTPPTDLDDCNGHEDAERGYHYHVTEKFPYLIVSYRGTPTAANIDRPRFAGRNGPFEMRDDGPPPPPLKIMDVMDTDRDYALSAKELQAAPKALLALDSDKDGKLSHEELELGPEEGPPPGEAGDDRRPPPPPGGPGGRRPGPLPMKTLDTDRDGELSAKEISAAAKSLLSLDKNHDGKLSREELRPPHPPGGGPGQGPQPGRPPGRDDFEEFPDLRQNSGTGGIPPR